MAERRVHYSAYAPIEPTPYFTGVSCGADVLDLTATSDADAVTCGSCLRLRQRLIDQGLLVPTGGNASAEGR